MFIQGNNTKKESHKQEQNIDTKQEEHFCCYVCFETKRVPFSLPCNHIFCYMCVKSCIINRINVCPLCRALIPKDIFENAMFSKELFEKINEVNFKGYKWQYSGRTSGWWYYEDDINTTIEEKYLLYIKSGMMPKYNQFNLKILGRDYIVNFESDVQINKTNTFITRKIRRVEIKDESELFKNETKGISGVRLVEEKELPKLEKKYDKPDTNNFHPNFISHDLNDFEELSTSEEEDYDY